MHQASATPSSMVGHPAAQQDDEKKKNNPMTTSTAPKIYWLPVLKLKF
jgi:hypothetical protein